MSKFTKQLKELAEDIPGCNVILLVTTLVDNNTVFIEKLAIGLKIEELLFVIDDYFF